MTGPPAFAVIVVNPAAVPAATAASSRGVRTVRSSAAPRRTRRQSCMATVIVRMAPMARRSV